MSADTRNARRRWLPIVVVALIVGSVAVAFTAWWLSRLNTAERDILGEWSFVDARDPRIRHTIRFESDRRFFIRSSGGVTPGSWRITGSDLALAFDVLATAPRSPSDFVDRQIDRLQNPQHWQPSTNRLELEEMRESSIRLRTSDGKETIFRRVTATDE